MIPVLTPYALLRRMTHAEELALATSTNPAVCVIRTRFLAAERIIFDHPETLNGKSQLVQHGILTQARADEIFA